MFDAKRENSGVKIPPLPEPPAPKGTGEWPEIEPPLIRTPNSADASAFISDADANPSDGVDALSALVTQATELERRVDDLVAELAARDVTIAEQSNDAEEIRTEFHRRTEELRETRGLLEDSEARVRTLEDWLREQLDQGGPARQPAGQLEGRNGELQNQFNRLVEQHTDLNEVNLQLEAQLAEARQVQEELLRRQARRSSPPIVPEATAHLEAEIAVARSLMEGLESECVGKESKIGRLNSEITALRNILKHVDGPAILAAKRRLGSR